MTVSALERWRRLPKDSDREEYFQRLRAAVTEYYLADPSNPYQQSGRGSGPERWEETRRLLVTAVHRSGDFIDVGCANGLLLESLVGWAAREGFRLRTHGIDFVPELIELARLRFPEHRHSFAVANAFHWLPTRRYDFVRTNVEYVPPADRVTFVRRQFRAVAPGGRLILCHYRNAADAYVDLGALAHDAGLAVVGRIEIPGTAVAWIDQTE